MWTQSFWIVNDIKNGTRSIKTDAVTRLSQALMGQMASSTCLKRIIRNTRKRAKNARQCPRTLRDLLNPERYQINHNNQQFACLILMMVQIEYLYLALNKI